MFLIFVNDLTEQISSKFRLFADGALQYNTRDKSHDLQEDPNKLVESLTKKLIIDKCAVLSVKFLKQQQAYCLCDQRLKLQPHEGDNLDERIVTIPCKRVYGATQTRPCEKSGCSRLRCTVEVSSKMRLFRSREQLR